MKRNLSIWLAIILLLAVGAASAAAQNLDEGKLVMSWFGKDLEFREVDEIDYLWVASDYSLDGHTIHFKEWPEPEFLGEKASERDANDRRLARQMNVEMARLFQEEWGRGLSGVKTSLSEGDLVAEGRIVDCSTGSTAAKVLVGFGAGSGFTTIDLKIKEKKSGKLVLAMHHRVVSGTSWSTTDSKFIKWVGKVAKKASRGFDTLYSKGSRVKE